MTKAELRKALDGLPDDTRIYVPSIEVAGDIMPASYVQVDYVGDGGIVKVLITGASGFISLKAYTLSSSYTLLLGISPFIILQKIQSSMNSPPSNNFYNYV